MPHADDRFPDPRVSPTLDVPTAGRFLGLGRTASYQAAANGDLPVIRVGRKVLVSTARLARLLGLDDADDDGGRRPG